MVISNNVVKFAVGSTQVRVIVEDRWVEFNFKFKSGNWFRKYVSKAGYTGPEEIPEVARAILQKSYQDYLKSKEEKEALAMDSDTYLLGC